MKIALTLLSGVGYGGTTYFRNLIPALAAADRENEYHLFVPRGHELIGKIQQENFIFHICLKNNKSGLKRFLWEQLYLPMYLKRYSIDIIFTAKNLNVFLAPCKTVISLRNMEPLVYREYDNDWNLNVTLWMKWQLTKWSVRRADHIVAVSHSVRDRLAVQFPGIGNKVSVVYNGNPVPQYSESKAKNLNVILSASKFVAYANQLNLLKGYARFRDKNPNAPPLWFAGGVHDKKYFQKIQKAVEDYGLGGCVEFLGLVPHDRLLELMHQARVFVFPSTLEACPHTLIEAMACHVPIAASRTPPMPEICQDAALYFDPNNPCDIAEKIERVLDDTVSSQQRVRSGWARVEMFTWAKTAQGLITVFGNMR